MYLRNGTTQSIRFGPFLDSTDGVTPETGLTIAQADMQLSKDGGAFAQKSAAGNATHDTDGWYSTSLSTTDTDTNGILELQINVAGSLPVWKTYTVIPAASYDALVTNGLNDIAATEIVSSGAITTSGGAVSTVTTLTNLPAIPANWLTAAGIAASALDGKGDWNIGKTGYSLTQTFPANFASQSITAGGLVDITQAAADKAWSTTTRVLTAGTNLNDLSFADIWTGTLTESYAADGAAPTPAQAIFLTMQNLQDFSITGTTLTVMQLDGTTTAATYTLDSTSPTSRTRAT